MRLWRSDGAALHVAAGEDPGWSLALPARPGLGPTPGGMAWLEPVTGAPGVWLEVAGRDGDDLRQAAPRVLALVAALLESERQRAHVAEELAGRYEEI
ncbi:MAG: hypothetical protein ABI785_04920, partial [Gemmatimonadales bacterium]